MRWREWYATKLPFVWTACATAAAASHLSDGAVLGRSVALILFTCLCGAFGHVANDHADRACDRIAGRLSPVAELSRRTVRWTLALLGTTALGVLAFAAPRPAAIVAGTAALALAAAYSLPPLRLKARGASGVWAAAAAQRTLPVLLAFAVLGDLNAQAWAFAAVAQLAGLRWMLVHQVGDANDDRRARVGTYVTRAGKARARLLLRRIVLPLEIAAIGLALWTISASMPGSADIAVAGALAAALWVSLQRGPAAAYSLEGFDRQPLAGFYQAIWPLGAMALLLASRPALWPLGAGFLLWQSRYMASQILTVMRCLRRRAPA